MMMHSNNIIQIPGSPVSPKSVVATFLDHDRLTTSKVCSLPRDDHESNRLDETESMEVVAAAKDDTHNQFVPVSTPFHGMYSLKPNEETILGPMMRAVLPLDARVAAHCAESVMDDILLNQLKFQRDSACKNDAVFCGHMNGGHRIVLTRQMGNNDTYNLFCSDADQAQHFLLILRACNVDVKKLSF